jgi:hypothetical protein
MIDVGVRTGGVIAAGAITTKTGTMRKLQDLEIGFRVQY